MTLSLVMGFVWVVVAAITAMLPMRGQMVPGILLLISAPALIWLIGRDYGPIVGLLALVGFISMMRNPLRYFWRKARGLPAELPPELRDLQDRGGAK